MRKEMTWIMAIVLVSCGCLALAATGASKEQLNPSYRQFVEKLRELTPDKAITVNMGVEKDAYQLQEPIEIRFQASKDCYFTLMDISEDGSITFLAPSAKIPPDAKLQGDKAYSSGVLPKSASEYDFGLGITAVPPTGTETLYLFCSPQKLDLVKANFQETPFVIIKPDDKKGLEALLAQLDRFKGKEWSGATVQFQVGAKTAVAPAPKAGMTRGFLPPIKGSGTTGKFWPPIKGSGTSGKTDGK